MVLAGRKRIAEEFRIDFSPQQHQQHSGVAHWSHLATAGSSERGVDPLPRAVRKDAMKGIPHGALRGGYPRPATYRSQHRP